MWVIISFNFNYTMSSWRKFRWILLKTVVFGNTCNAKKSTDYFKNNIYH